MAAANDPNACLPIFSVYCLTLSHYPVASSCILIQVLDIKGDTKIAGARSSEKILFENEEFGLSIPTSQIMEVFNYL
jgi:hypothetical protein